MHGLLQSEGDVLTNGALAANGRTCRLPKKAERPALTRITFAPHINVHTDQQERENLVERSAEGMTPTRSEPSVTIRIVQIVESWGGVEHNNTQLALRLSGMGHRVVITAVGAKAYSLMPPRYRNRFELEEIPWSLERPPTFKEWFRIMWARPAQIVVLPKNWWAKGGLAMVWAAGLTYPRVITREEMAVPKLPRPGSRRIAGVLPTPSFWWIRHLAYGRLLSMVPSRIICVSQTVRDRLVSQCAFPQDRTVVAHNGVDTNIFRYDEASRESFRGRFGIGDATTVFGSVGRIDNSAKRHDWSLRAFADLKRERPNSDLHFLLIGDGEDRGAMLALAEDIGVAEHLTIAPFTSEPWEAYSSLDVFLMPSAFEAFGLSIAEAMSCERCVVGMRVDGLGEILCEPGIGFGVAPDDFGGFVEAMRQALDLGVERRHEMGRVARESIVRRFDADKQYEAIIRHVLGAN